MIEGLVPQSSISINPQISGYQQISTYIQIADLIPLQLYPSPFTIGAAALLDLGGAIFSFYDIYSAAERGDISCEEYHKAIINWNMANIATGISYLPGIGLYGWGAEIAFYGLNLVVMTGDYNPFHGWW